MLCFFCNVLNVLCLESCVVSDVKIPNISRYFPPAIHPDLSGTLLFLTAVLKP
jgi:hypothetical protein